MRDELCLVSNEPLTLERRPWKSVYFFWRVEDAAGKWRVVRSGENLRGATHLWKFPDFLPPASTRCLRRPKTDVRHARVSGCSELDPDVTEERRDRRPLPPECASLLLWRVSWKPNCVTTLMALTVAHVFESLENCHPKIDASVTGRLKESTNIFVQRALHRQTE